MIIARGAEAVIERIDDKIVKERIRKRYRIKELDDFLIKSRTRKEVRLMVEAKRNGIETPPIFRYNEKEGIIEMGFIEGKQFEKITCEDCKKIGFIIKKMHESGIIHGDLTTSNMIKKDGKIFLIDFGLGFFSNKIEDKAEELILFKRSLETKYKNWQECWKSFKESYENEDVFERMKKIEKRWRYHK